MTKFTIYTDIHIGSPIAILEQEVFNEPAHENTILLGDIVDLANCKKSEVRKHEQYCDSLIHVHGLNYLDGNHERWGVHEKFIQRGRIMFSHGDLEANPERWLEYRAKPHGAGFLKRKFLVPLIREAEEIIDRKPKADFLKRVVSLCRLSGATTYCCGHFHVKEIHDFMHEGIRIVILPRGKTVIEL